MGKKLLSVFFIIFAFFLNPFLGFGQTCPTSVSISADPGTTICAGTQVTFTANATGGSEVQYQWQLNNTDIYGATSATYTTSSLSNASKIRVKTTSSSDTTCNKLSNEVTMTVNAKITPTVSVTASKTSICPGESVTFSASNTGGGTNPVYAFYLNNQTPTLQTGSSNTYTTTELNNGDKIKVVLTSKVECVTSATAETTSSSLTVRAGTPSVPGAISGSASVCPGTTQTYSINAVAGATSYQWTLPSGFSGSSTSTLINVTTGTSSGTISVKAINDCGTSGAQDIPVTVKSGTPAVPGTITGTTAACPGVAETYSIATVSGATEYIWSLPNGWTGTSTTNSINVTTGTYGSGNISVQAKNDCGTSTPKTLAVSVKPGTPAVPATINGTVAVCPGTQQTYSITGVTGATSYIWTLPNGWTGNSTTNSITSTTGTTGGNITVKAINDCGTSSEQTLTVTVKPGTPATPGLVSGAKLVCPGTSEIYSITPINGATEYIWTLPNGWTGSSSSETITVNTAQSGSGNITVKTKNDCGTSTAASIAVSVDKPAPVMSETVTGPVEVCSTATGLVYTIPAITNATEYIWTLPSGWNITAGTGTRTITVIATSSSGNVSVVAKNTCGESAASANLVVSSTTGVPSTPGTITAPNLPTNAICPPATGIQFSVPEVTGAKSYLWTLPNGWEITSGSGTNNIVVRVNATAATTANASISVEAVNICGNSTKSTLSGIAIDNHVVTNAGADQTICKLIAPINIEGTYSFSGTNANLKPIWSAPATMGSFGSTSKLITTFTPSQAALDAGSVILTLTTDAPSGACGPGKDEMKITFKPLPTATITATSPVCNGNTATLAFTGTPNSRVTYKLPNGTNQSINIGASGTATVPTAALTANSTYTLVSILNLDTPACTFTFPTSASTTITVTPKPTASITYAGAPLCTSLTTGQSPTLTGTNGNTGGTYTSSSTNLTIDPSTGAITPSTSTPGTYTVTYSTPAGGGCEPVTSTTQVTITKAPTAAISYAGIPFCTSDSTAKPVILTGTDGFSGGIFSAPAGLTINSSTGAITASSSAAGTYIVTYNTPAAGGCASVPATTEVTITKAPTITISYPEGPFCLSDTSLKPVTISGTDAFTGGTYSASAGLSINLSTGEINPSASNVGTHTVTYTSPATFGCGEVTATTDITITQTPAAAFSYNEPFCSSDETAHLPEFTNSSGAFEGGTFRATPDGLDLNPGTGAIIGLNSTPKTYTVFYQFPEGAGCGSTEVETSVTVTQVPELEFSYISLLCNSDETAYSPTFSTNAVGAYEGGTFSGTAGLDLDAAGNIMPSNSTPGIHTITYSTPEANGCGPVQVSTQVEIFEKVQITTQPINSGICSTDPASFEVVATGENLTYLWKRKDGVAINNATGITSSKLSFNNATSGNAGEYFVEVSGISPCSMIQSEPVTLNVDENIIIEEPLTEVPFCGDGFSVVTMKFIAHANGAPLTFKWYKGSTIVDESDPNISIVTDPADSDGRYTGTLEIINVTTAYNGDYHVEVNGPVEFTCSTAVTKPFQLRLNEMPELPVVQDMVVCQYETPDAFTVTTGTNLKWYLNEADENYIVGESGQPVAPTPPTDVPGDFYYWVTQQPEACESEKVQVKVTVKEKPAVPVLTSEEAVVKYCLGEATRPLTATSTTGATLNWYDSEDGAALDSAPTPKTENPVVKTYWVSQTPNDGFGCESERAVITVTVYPLPEVTASVEENIICLGSPALLSATGGVTYLWFDGENVIGNEASISYTPTEAREHTFKVVVTNANSCENTAEVKVKVDEKTIPGIITGPETVCISSPSGSFLLEGNTGEIQRWESSTDNGTTWTEIASTSSTLQFNDLTAPSIFRAVVKNGVCDEVTSNEIEVTIDPLPIGGELNFAGNGRVFTICQNAVGDYAEPLNLIGKTGEVISWKYRNFDATTWSTLVIDGQPFTGTSLTADQIESFNFQKTTVFQVEVRSGVCAPDALSETAILSVIPSDITPTPVTADPNVVCLGEEVTLNSETGYQTGTSMLDEGAFDNASITNKEWRIRREGISGDLGFDTDANNTEFDRWKRATPRAFTTASLTSPFNTSGVIFDSGAEENKGFALISGNYRSTMETPIFSMGSTDQGILTFDQAYNLTPGASIKVEISRDGGATYETVYIRSVPSTATTGIKSGNFGSFGSGTVDSHPENKIEIDLGRYLGQSNLRIRFNYTGVRSGDVWAVDNIDVPEGPGGVTMEWRDYTNPEVPEGIFIGTNNSERYIPTKIGLNIFEVKTKLVYNSNGDACEVAENAERIEVFVFDKYTTSTTAMVGSCGNNSAQLNATVTNASGALISSFPTPDGYIGEWKIEGGTGYTLIDSNTADQIPAINDPKAILSANEIGTFKASFILKPTLKNEAGVLYENKDCKPATTTLDIVFKACTTLDFDGVDDFVDLGEGYIGDYSIEAWIRPEATTGTIISTPQLEISMGDLPGVTPNNRWYHIAVDSDGKLYVDGIATGTTISKTGSTRAFIGARWNAPNPENFFSGWIEEVRIWNGKITEKNIRFTMNQRLKADGNIGVIVDMAHPDAPAFTNLAGYYQLIATNILNGGYTLDLAVNAVNGKLRNMTTTQENTAPLPFYTGSNGSWDTAATWARPTVWYIPNTSGITWNIVRTSHNVNANRDISVLGLVSEVNTLTMEGTNPTGWQSGAGGSGNPLTISHYLKLNGGIDLAGESQILQPELSIVAPTSSGWLERDQQGTANSFNYNYWSSPVSSAPGNSPYTIKGAMKDGSNQVNGIPSDLDFGDPYAYADGGLGNPRKISRYWLNLFHGTENVYAEWLRINETISIPVGEGYTMKGTAGNVGIDHTQNYTFRGIPNNGDVNLSISPGQSYMIGNPYPSAIIADQFIKDNLKDVTNGGNTVNSFNGTLYFWSHFAGGNTHILKEYIGGYAVYNLSGGTKAFANDDRINNQNPNLQGGERPEQFIPVGQSFFVNSVPVNLYDESSPMIPIPGGNIKFKNSQRVFQKEEINESVFHKPEIVVKGKKENKDHTDTRQKIWLKFQSPKGYHREILVAADANATDGFDLGYDAPMIEYNVEDMFWLLGSAELVIQGISDFNEQRIIPLGLVIDQKKEFTIKIEKLLNFEDVTPIYLKDKLNDTIHDLRKSEYVSTSEPGYINDRFELIFFKEEPPVIEVPGEIPGEDVINLTITHAHDLRQIRLINPEEMEITGVYLFDLNGNLIDSYGNLPNEKEIKLNVGSYATGVYLVKVYAKGKVVTKKIIISN